MNDDDNIEPLHGRKRGKAQNASPLSIRRELQMNAYTIGMFALDTFGRRPMLMKPIPRPNMPLDANFSPRQLKDSDLTALMEHLEERGFRKLAVGMIRDVILLEADTNAFSPPAQRIKALTWDGTPRLDNFFIDFCGVHFDRETAKENERLALYVKNVTRCFFISVVARTMRPGCKADYVVVLEGEQGEQKSALLRMLALDDDWFSDSMPRDLATKDAREHLPGNLIIELAELAQLKSTDIESLKAFITCQHDKYRPSFGRFVINWPRQNVFVGTVNKETYLLDNTGNRRFWPLKTTALHLEEAALSIEQVYAEAYAAFDSGEQWWLDAETEVIARAEQDARLIRDPWYRKVAEYLRLEMCHIDGFRWLSVSDVLTRLDIPTGQWSRGHEMRISAILKQLGGERRMKNRLWSYRFLPSEES